jgi:hypothetical protein
MGRSIRAIRTRDLPNLFSFFGLQVQQELLDAAREEISARFAVEVGEILRLCTRLRERERYQLFREALRLAYESALRRRERFGGLAVMGR